MINTTTDLHPEVASLDPPTWRELERENTGLGGQGLVLINGHLENLEGTSRTLRRGLLTIVRMWQALLLQ